MAIDPVQLTYDGYNLQDATVITSDIDGDEAAPPKALGVYEMPVLHGAKKTFERVQARRITIAGVVKSASISGLVGKLEEIKELFTRQDKQLAITYPNNYPRLYTASVEGNLEVKRDPWSLNIAPFKATFVCAEPWSVQSATSISGVYNISSSIQNVSIGISGTLDPQPVIYFNPTISGSKFLFANTTTGDSIEISTTISGASQLRIDTYNFTVELNGSQVPFKGTFPRFTPGVNEITVVTVGAGGTTTDQKFEDTSLLAGSSAYVGSNYFSAQSFVPAIAKLLYVELYMRYGSGTAGNITVEIRTDNSGKPSSTSLGSATIGSFTGLGNSWKRAIFSSPITLTAGTTYWIVASSPTSQYPYTYGWNIYNTASQYASGKAMQSSNSGITWSNSGSGVSDFFFRTIGDYGGALTGKLVVEYNPRRW